jgi:hypothetical protein
MGRPGSSFLIIAFVTGVCVGTFAQAPSPGAKTDRINACSLLTKEEVKKIVPWAAMLDQFPVEEEPVGTSGSSCNYPNVHIQVLPYTPGFVETARKQEKFEPLPGVGDEAYFRDNRGEYAELLVRSGQRIVTVQKDIGTNRTAETEKPAVVALAKALIAKLH